MLIYLYLLILFAIAAFVLKNDKFGLICIIVLFIIVIFRGETVGSDTSNYIRRGLPDFVDGMKTQQFIYAFLTSIMTPPSHLLIVTFAIISFWGIYVSSKKFEVRPAAAFFFFIIFEHFNLSLNIARQYAAAGILMIAYTFLFEQGRKRYLFFPMVVLAFGFHSSSLICLPLYFCRNIDFSKIKVWVIALFFAVAYASYHLVLKDYYLTIVHAFELSQDMEVYSMYFNEADDADLSLGGVIIARSMPILSMYIFIVLSRIKTDKVKIITSLFFVSIIMDIFFSELYGNIGRIRFCVNIINVIAYSYYFLKIRDKYKIIVAPAVIVLFGYSFIHLIMGYAYQTTPYKFDFWLF